MADDDANPFADPSIMAAAETLDAGDTVVGDYDPFGDSVPSGLDSAPPLDDFVPEIDTAAADRKKKRKKKKPLAASSGRESDSFVAPPDITEESIRARERDLARREAEMLQDEYRDVGGSAGMTEAERRAREEQLYRKEKELVERERLISQAESLARPKNWPKCWPILYHDIKTEIIEPERVSIMRMVYLEWLMTVVAYLWNTIALFVAWVSGSLSASYGTPSQPTTATMSWIYSLLFAIVAIPLMWILWYYRLYKYMKSAKVSTRYYAFFIFYVLNIGFTIAMAVGLFGGSAGGGLMIQLMTCASGKCGDGTQISPDVAGGMGIMGVFCAVAMGLWICSSVWGLWVLRVTWRFFKANFGKDGEVLDDETRQAAVIAAQAARAI